MYHRIKSQSSGKTSLLFQRVLEHNHEEMSLEDIKLYLDTGQMQLFVANTEKEIVGLVTTEVVDYPRHSSLNIAHCAGDCFENWVEFEPLLQSHAKRNKCKTMELDGRRGWEKKLSPLDYQFKSIKLHKEVN